MCRSLEQHAQPWLKSIIETSHYSPEDEGHRRRCTLSRWAIPREFKVEMNFLPACLSSPTIVNKKHEGTRKTADQRNCEHIRGDDNFWSQRQWQDLLCKLGQTQKGWTDFLIIQLITGYTWLGMVPQTASASPPHCRSQLDIFFLW